jgi:hypothetical protein
MTEMQAVTAIQAPARGRMAAMTAMTPRAQPGAGSSCPR